MTYESINPAMTVHYVYRNRHVINEFYRLSFTKMRVSGHCLACETARWNRRGWGHLPLEVRVSPCGDVQTEQHTIERCPLTQLIRDLYLFSTATELFAEQILLKFACKITYDILNAFKE